MTILGQWDSGTLPTIVGSGISSNSTEGLRPPSIQVAQVSGSSSAVKWEYASPISQSAYRFYFKSPSAWPSASFPLLWVSTITGDVISFRIDIAGLGAPGQIRFRRGSTNTQIAASANNTLSVSTWYRVETLVTQNGSSGHGQALLYVGDNTTPIWDSGTIAGDYGTTHNRVGLGNWISTPTVSTMYLDDILLTDGTSLVGSAGTVTPSGPSITVWDGSKEVTAAVTLWDGLNEVSVNLS